MSTAAPPRDDRGRLARAARFEAGPSAAVGLTVIAFVLRVVGMPQSMFGDELFLYAVISESDPAAVVDKVVATESTPPLHFLLAWLGSQAGEPTIWFRLPSLLLGTATVPLVYVLGTMTVGRRAALVGSALVALDPFAIFYSTEGRAYATLAFLTTVSTIALLKALRGEGRGWWVAFTLASWAALMAHYQAVFVVLAQGGWALWHRRDRAREVLLSYGAVLLAYAAWLPSFIVQSEDSAANRGEALSALTLESALRDLVVVLSGHPFLPLREIPGRAVLVALGLAVAVGAGVLLAARIASGERLARARPELVLVVLLAIVTPLGGLLYSLGPGDVYVPRGMIPSLGPAMLAIGALLVAPRRPQVALAAVALAIGAMSVAAVTATFDPDHRRPPLRSAAEFVDRQARPGDTVIDQPFFPVFSPRQLRDGLEAHLQDPHNVVKADLEGERAWRDAAPGSNVISVGPWAPGAQPGPPPRLRSRFRLVERHVWRGWIPIFAFTYARPSTPSSGP
jgi:hypothetical protein